MPNPDVAKVAEGLTEREAIVAWLRDAISAGYTPRNENNGKCPHGTYQHEDCLPCYDEFLEAVLASIERGDHLVRSGR